MSAFSPPPLSSLQPEPAFTPPPLSSLQPEGSDSPVLNAAGDVAAGVWDKLNPVNMAKGAMATFQAIRDKPLDVAKEIFLHPYMAIGRGVEAAKAGKPEEAAAHFSDAVFGVPGSGTEEASAEMATPGQRATGVGHALGIGAAAYAGAKLPEVAHVVKTGTRMALQAAGSVPEIPEAVADAAGLVHPTAGFAAKLARKVPQILGKFGDRMWEAENAKALADVPTKSAADYAPAGITSPTASPAALAASPATPPLLNSAPLAPVQDLRVPMAAAPVPPANPYANSTLDAAALDQTARTARPVPPPASPPPPLNPYANSTLDPMSRVTPASRASAGEAALTGAKPAEAPVVPPAVSTPAASEPVANAAAPGAPEGANAKLSPQEQEWLKRRTNDTANKDEVIASWMQKQGMTPDQVVPGQPFKDLVARVNKDVGKKYTTRIDAPDHPARVKAVADLLDAKIAADTSSKIATFLHEGGIGYADAARMNAEQLGLAAQGAGVATPTSTKALADVMFQLKKLEMQPAAPAAGAGN